MVGPQYVPYQKQPSYPHMKPRDVALWEQFIHDYPDAYDQVAYDVYVGEIPDFVQQQAQDIGGDIHKLYQWEVDVLGQKNGRVDVIEIKPDAGAGAIGQVLCYDVLLEDILPEDVQTQCVIITDRMRPNMPRIAARHRVRIVVI